MFQYPERDDHLRGYIELLYLITSLDNAEMILDMLWWSFAEGNLVDNEKCKSDFRAIREGLSKLDSDTTNEIFDLVCDLCTEKERLSFQGGVKFGVLLMRELQNE